MRSFLAGLSISLLMGQDPFVIDSSLSNSLPKTLANSIEIADVNNDENNDIIISGYDSTRFGLYIDITLGNDVGSFDQGYETNFITYSDTIAEYFGGIGNASLADVNMDGKIDIDPMITHTLTLDEINEGFDLMHAGESIRSVVVY